jgi:4-amino-4-deoxy-L-arabinose transferase-like glycosyltransferase
MHNLFTAGVSENETYHAATASYQLPEIISSSISRADPPLYHIILHTVFQLFGTDTAVVRGLSLFFLFLTLLFVFFIVSSIWSKKTALYAILLTLGNPFLFYWAFKGGPQIMLAFLVTASMLFLLKKKVVGYILATLAAFYTHPAALLILPVQIIWMLLDIVFAEKKSAGKMLKGLFITFLLYLPWIFILIKNPAGFTGSYFILKNDRLSVNDVYLSLLIGSNLLPLTDPAVYVILILIIIRDWTQKFKKGIFLMFWFLIPTAVAWTISQQLQQPYPIQLLAFTVPAATIVMATGKRVPASNMVIALLVILLGLININTFTNPGTGKQEDGVDSAQIESTIKTDIEE